MYKTTREVVNRLGTDKKRVEWPGLSLILMCHFPSVDIPLPRLLFGYTNHQTSRQRNWSDLSCFHHFRLGKPRHSIGVESKLVISRFRPTTTLAPTKHAWFRLLLMVDDRTRASLERCFEIPTTGLQTKGRRDVIQRNEHGWYDDCSSFWFGRGLCGWERGGLWGPALEKRANDTCKGTFGLNGVQPNCWRVVQREQKNWVLSCNLNISNSICHYPVNRKRRRRESCRCLHPLDRAVIIPLSWCGKANHSKVTPFCNLREKHDKCSIAKRLTFLIDSDKEVTLALLFPSSSHDWHDQGRISLCIDETNAPPTTVLHYLIVSNWTIESYHE